MQDRPASSPGLAQELRQLGVKPGDLLMVHASLRKLGPIDGGAAALIEALDLAVGADGTLLMMVSPDDDFAWVNERPESERAQLLSGAVPFDTQQAKTAPDVGVLAEVFRQHPGTLVNDHPEGRFAARGQMAAGLLRDAPWHDYYGPGSPLERLVKAGGKVLRLGADLDTVTLLHYAEYLAEVPNKRRVRRHRLVMHEGVATVRVIECLNDSDGIVEHPGEDYFAVILRSYLSEGRAQVGQVGQARAELIDAQDLVQRAVAWLEEHLNATRSRR